MERKTTAGVGIVVLGILAIVAVALFGPTAACESTNGDIGGLAPIELIEFSGSDIVYSRDGGAGVCTVSMVVLGVPVGLVVASVGLFVLGS